MGTNAAFTSPDGDSKVPGWLWLLRRRCDRLRKGHRRQEGREKEKEKQWGEATSCSHESLSSLQGFTFLDGFFTSDWPSDRYYIWSGTILNRSLVLLCQIVLLMCPSTLLAQRGGHNAGRPSTGASSPTPNTSDMNDFNRAIAIQATPDQIAQFQQLNKSTETASKHAQNLIQPTENANRPNSSRYTDLSDAVDEAQTNIQHFVSSFSTAQQSGLKPQIKKLSKADSDLSKQSKALAQERERSQINDKKLVAVTERLDKALTGFRTELIDLGKEMGVQPEEHSP
jgi:hypothetical protein